MCGRHLNFKSKRKGGDKLSNNNLKKQVYIYSVDTSSFYNEAEQNLHKKLLKVYRYRDHLKTLNDVDSKHKKFVRERIKMLKGKLFSYFSNHTYTRNLRQDALRDSNVISVFDSVLTRTVGTEQNTLSEDIIVVQAYYFQVLEDIIENGFLHNGEKYIYLTSSAGQIRTKKSVFAKESTWNKHRDSLTCGLSIEDINKLGGININKYQAYLALTNSASAEWKGFDINKAIVVDDLETNVHSLVDYIDRDTYEIDPKEMDIPIEHTDGCGMILPGKSKKSFMVRLPWLKGMLVPFPFDKFARGNKAYIVRDVYGKEWDIIEDKIEVIFTKSQFKMWKYYTSWADYKEKFVKYNCQAAMLNEEDTSGSGKLNYQMLQTLTDITDVELKEISAGTVKDILQIGTDRDTMLRVLGATETSNKNSFQKALHMYPELLNDVHAKEVIKNKKKSLVKDAKSAKLNVNGKYTFICPDLYGFCEKLFLGIEDPKGLLADGEVYCSLYDSGKVDVLRSPHLYREHAVKNNVIDDEKGKWFITEGIYTSVHDAISKVLQFDVDGDKALVIQDAIVNIAERNMQGIIPLYYEMAKSEAEKINTESIYRSLTLAYKANIGEISNNITKIWNSSHVDMDVIKWLCMESNFEIDYAKTLFKPTRPDVVDVVISQYVKNKVPHFFQHAKDKEVDKVEPINNSTVNRLNDIIPNKRINFAKVAGKFDYNMLMKNPRVNLDDDIIHTYTKLDRSKKWMMKKQEDIKSTDKLYIYRLIRDELLKINNDVEYVTDVLIKHLYRDKNSKHKTTLWESFGEQIVINLQHNINGTKDCESCGEAIERVKGKKYCTDCATERELKRVKIFKRKKRNDNKTA